jgi:hypothetical protein
MVLKAQTSKANLNLWDSMSLRVSAYKEGNKIKSHPVHRRNN